MNTYPSASIALTGSTGFVGQWVQKIVTSQPELSNITVSNLLENDDGSRIDIRDQENVRRRVGNLQPDAIIHLAAVAAPREANKNPIFAWEVNVMGTLTLAHAILEKSPDTRLVFAGSAESYGNCFNKFKTPIREEASFDPNGTYGATKAACDIMLGQLKHQGLMSVRFRPFNHTGPGQEPIYVASDFARQIALIEKGQRAPELLVGNLSAKRDFMDVRDVANAYIMAALNQTNSLPTSVALNLSTGTGVSIEHILQSLLKESDIDIAVKIDKSRLRANDIEFASGNPTLAKDLLGWQPKISLSDTLNDLINYWRANL
ncbi:MAG: GDP-mannose 4,6-dehydratase [Lentilitoribacter sp.]